MKYRTISKLFRWGKYVAIAIIIVLIVYWARFTPVSVFGHKVGRGNIIAEVMGTGTLEARVQTVISSKISGRIDQIFLDQGDQVEKGQTLLRLDDSELKQQVEIGRSSLSAVRASVGRVQVEQTRAQVVLDQARRDHVRNQKLFTNKTISSNEMEKSEKALSVAEADLASAKASVAESRKNLIVARSTLDYQLARLDDTVIKAPFNGLIVRRDREPGDVVVPGSSIFLLISTEEMWVRAWVDETEMEEVSPGQKARVIFRSEPDYPFSGEIVRLGRETDRETREFIVDVRVESLPKNWAVGQRAEAFIKTAEKKDVVLLPAKFIFREKDRTGVFIEKNGKAVWRSIRIGLRGRGNVEIIEGLNPGDTIITPLDSKRFFEGRKVKVILP
ncbi:MAG: efflux RND transporter periplasmic adaptor subunit [Deltaproteobacteria bacterium]|nr:efflux RND transporter periplasmic adaptor subunit [Deltaproteobacteria bacterium]